MSTGTCSIEKRRLAAALPLSAEDTGSLQWRGLSAKIISTSPPHCKHSLQLLYFSSCKLAASSQGFFEGLIYAQDLGLRLTLEEGLS